MKKIIFILLLVVIGIILIIGCTKEISQSTTEEPKEETKSGPAYKYVTEKPTGWFKTGQEADIILYATGFNDSGGSLVLNHPGKVASDGKRLIVADTWNNRVLIWNEIPKENDNAPDLVLGQLDFDSNVAMLGADGLNWPMGVATYGKKLLVADTNNNRILVWNEFPTRNGQPADLVLGAFDFETRTDSSYGRDDRNRRTHIDWPWAIWTNGEKVIAGSTGDGAILVWNTFPTENNQQPDLILGVENFSMRFGVGIDDPNFKIDPMIRVGGARSIDSDGKRLVIGTYQPPQAYIWNEFPTRNGQPADFILQIKRYDSEEPGGVMGLSLKDDKLFAVGGPPLVFIWNTFPTSNYQKPDIKLGVDRLHEEVVVFPDKKIFYPNNFASPFGVATDGNHLIVSDTNNNRVLIFDQPLKPDSEADIILGRPEIFVSRNSFTNPIPFTDGKRLIVGVDDYGVFIYNNIPDENKAKADILIGKTPSGGVIGGHAITDGEKLIMVCRGCSRVFIWNKIPQKDNKLPDIYLGSTMNDDFTDLGRGATKGRIGMNEPTRAATDGVHLFVSDTKNNRVLVWNEIPVKSQTPADFVLGQDNFESSEPGNAPNRFASPVGISSDGNHLAVADMENQRVLIWKLPIIMNGQNPDLILKQMKPIDSNEPIRFNLPQDVIVYGGKFFVADGGFHRVLIWNKFPETDNSPPDTVIGQKDFYSSSPSNTQDGLFVPVSLSFDGSFLWVGETKWSNRLLRYSVGK